ncbi:hypothetical protein BMW22_27950 (plasmid) [Rhizobium leguminosarum]|uniref:Uncharacterized protein n=1 Tax=Rhizobium leguminosarum TaxID=384 RepID=A0A1L3ZIC5_RHILE|nr:zinc-binding dehydrogenase [Rhizobium leguminosarum]API55351.1 hypothetical protein BMW22_27950 [Rhizobium leguminosarum]
MAQRRGGGQSTLISGPPNPSFAEALGLNPLLKSRGVQYSFLLMRADGRQLQEIAGLIDSAALRPVEGQGRDQMQ